MLFPVLTRVSPAEAGLAVTCPASGLAAESPLDAGLLPLGFGLALADGDDEGEMVSLGLVFGEVELDELADGALNRARPLLQACGLTDEFDGADV